MTTGLDLTSEAISCETSSSSTLPPNTDAWIFASTPNTGFNSDIPLAMALMTGEGLRVAASPESAIEAGTATRRADATKDFILIFDSIQCTFYFCDQYAVKSISILHNVALD
mmetsp:Transcript_7203/g.15565  ORF Transcript_7203/g.15565 Transcript_7203/m.15565 type:complete len:112 (-) Transcript_7203:33-368(-)